MNWHPLQAFLHRNWSCLWSCPLPGWSFSLHTLEGRCSSLSYAEKVHNQLSGQCMTKCGELWPSGTPNWLRSAELGMFPCDFLVETSGKANVFGGLGSAHSFCQFRHTRLGRGQPLLMSTSAPKRDTLIPWLLIQGWRRKARSVPLPEEQASLLGIHGGSKGYCHESIKDVEDNGKEPFNSNRLSEGLEHSEKF